MEVNGQLHVPAAEKDPLPPLNNDLEAGWAPLSVLKLRRTAIHLSSNYAI